MFASSIVAPAFLALPAFQEALIKAPKPCPTKLIPAPAATAFILAIQRLSFSGSTAKASAKGINGACSLTKFAILPASELLEIKSATAPSDAITAPLCKNLILLTPFTPIPAALAVAATLSPLLAAPAV